MPELRAHAITSCALALALCLLLPLIRGVLRARPVAIVLTFVLLMALAGFLLIIGLDFALPMMIFRNRNVSFLLPYLALGATITIVFGTPAYLLSRVLVQRRNPAARPASAGFLADVRTFCDAYLIATAFGGLSLLPLISPFSTPVTCSRTTGRRCRPTCGSSPGSISISFVRMRAPGSSSSR
jgi:hypothetical protein